MSKAELIYVGGTLYTLSGREIMSGTLDECGAEFEGTVIQAKA
jgi:hypothetical protein